MNRHNFAGTAESGDTVCAVCDCPYDTVHTGDGPSYRIHEHDAEREQAGGEVDTRVRVPVVDEAGKVVGRLTVEFHSTKGRVFLWVGGGVAGFSVMRVIGKVRGKTILVRTGKGDEEMPIALELPDANGDGVP